MPEDHFETAPGPAGPAGEERALQDGAHDDRAYDDRAFDQQLRRDAREQLQALEDDPLPPEMAALAGRLQAALEEERADEVEAAATD